MLDRKTKDIDANIELLEDRRKLWKNVSILLGFATLSIEIVYLALAFLYFGILMNPDISFEKTVLYGLMAIPVFIYLAAIMVIVFSYNKNSSEHYDMLIFLKKHLEK
jgi:biotin transporter BioY